MTIETENLQEAPADAARRFARRLEDVKALHTERHRTVDGYTLRWCVECQQDWPCPTYARLVTDTPDR